MIEFKLPSLGADMDEGKLLEWKVKPGDVVKKGDVVAVVDTTKAAVEVETWQEGTVEELLIEPGTTVPVGTVIATFLAPVAPAPDRAAPAPDRAAPAPDRAAEMRKSIAAAMSRSKREIPHYYLSETIPMRRATEWLAAQNAGRPITARILMAALQLKAVALALKGFPDLNGTWRDGVYVPSAAVHLGVAISIRQGGLVAPAIRDVPELPLDELMKNLADLVKRARAGSLRSSEMSDPTITVTNLGEAGVESTFAVIHPPQVAIVGFGRVAPRPWVEDGAVIAMPTVVATLSADHRVSDGHRGAAWLAELARRLQEPGKP